jgi:hypothetical protein
MRSMVDRFGFAAIALLAAPPVSGHHSPAMYDQANNVTLEGVVTRFHWAYPHSYLDVRTEDEGGAVDWAIEMASPPNLTAMGWTSRSLAPGDRVTVVANPSANPDRNAALGNSLRKADGTVLSMNSVADSRRLFAAADLSGNWLPQPDRSVLSQFLRPQTSLSLTDEGLAAAEDFDAYADIPSKDCIDETPPLVMLFQEMLNIELGEDVIVIRQIGKVDREVHMQRASHDGAQYSHAGHSIGRWDDEVLVVDTTHFSDHRIGNAYGVPSGSGKHLVERFALSPDRTAMQYTFRVEDPEYVTEAVTGTVTLTHRPDLPYVNVPCDLESARRYLEFVEE